MKSIGIVFFMSLAFFLQCGKSISDAQNKMDTNAGKTISNDSRTEPNKPNAINMNEIFSSKGKKDEIEYQITGRLQKKGQYEGINYPNDNIVVEYELKNTSAKDFILYNQGHSSDPGGALGYVEPQTDGIIELSLKAFTEPTGKNCPARFAAIMPRGSLLKAGETVKDKLYVELPLSTKTPFDDCTPQTAMPPTPSKIKFCLGYQEISGENPKIDGEGNIRPLPDIKNQRLFCTDVGELK